MADSAALTFVGIEVIHMLSALRSIKLKILVFGPSPLGTHASPFEAELGRKRADIRDALNADGHAAVFPEDLLKGTTDPAIDNPYLWELSLVREYDLVVHLVGSPGSIDELSLFHRPELALKATFFFNRAHITGLPFAHATTLENIGATLQTYLYPDDLASCNLMTQVKNKVHKVQIGKYLIS